jgi:hypothetical protein
MYIDNCTEMYIASILPLFFLSYKMCMNFAAAAACCCCCLLLLLLAACCCLLLLLLATACCCCLLLLLLATAIAIACYEFLCRGFK